MDATVARSRPRRVLVIIVLVLLPFAVHAVWDQIEASLLAREVAALEARGEPVTTAAERAPLSDPEARRAARLYSAAIALAFGRAKDDTSVRPAAPYNFRSITLDLLRSHADELQRQYVDQEPALEMLDLATPLEFHGFGEVETDPMWVGVRQSELGALNALRADIASVSHDGDAAVAAIVAGIRLQRVVPLAGYLNFATARTFDSLQLLLSSNRLSEPQIELLRHAYDGTPDTDDLAGELRRSRARLLGDYWPYAPGHTPWALRLRPLRTTGLGSQLTFIILRPWITHEFRRMLTSYDEALPVAQMPWPGKLDALDRLGRPYGMDPLRGTWPQTSFREQLGHFPLHLGVMNLETAWPGSGLALARRRVALTVLAIERYRRTHGEALPPTLDALVPADLAGVPLDPFTGKPLRYMTRPGGYLVYSVDIDRKDDGGALSGKYSGRSAMPRTNADRDVGLQVPLAPER